MSEHRDDYEIGFGKPPRRNQFQPGQSGNPKGRPVGSRNFATILREISSQKVKVKDPEWSALRDEDGGDRDTVGEQGGDRRLEGYTRLHSDNAEPAPRSEVTSDSSTDVIRFIEAENGRPKYPEEFEDEIA